MLHDYVDDYLARMDALCSGPGSARDKLLSFWSAWLAHAHSEGIANQCLVVKLGAEVADLSDDMRRILDDGVAQLVSRIAQLLVVGAEEGSVAPADDPQAAAQMLYAKFLGAAILSKLSQDQIPLQQALSETTDFLTIR